MALGTLVNKNNNVQTPTETTSATSVNPIVIQMLSFQYPHSYSNSNPPTQLILSPIINN